MSFLCAIFLLGLSSLTTTANFNQVYKWTELEYEWPSETNRTQALKAGNFQAEKIEPLYMAVHRKWIFMSLQKNSITPVTLVSLPTSSVTHAPPKLTSFPSWDMPEYDKWEKCNKIEEAKGLEVDSIGRLWVLDEASSKSNCRAKLWMFDLNSNKTELVHHFSFHDPLHDLVLDETPNGTFAYISQWEQQHIVVFSLDQNESWNVYMLGIDLKSIALSPKNKEPRELYLDKWNSTNLYTISVAALRNGTRTANPELIGKWTGVPYRMLMDNQRTMYAAFLGSYISSWNTSQPFEEQRFYEVAGLGSFTAALDKTGTFWIMVFDEHRETIRLLNIGDRWIWIHLKWQWPISWKKPEKTIYIHTVNAIYNNLPTKL